MVIFPFKQYKYLVKYLKELPQLKLGRFDVNRFPNQELFIKLHTNVENKECLIIGSITPPDENLISLLLLSHTLKMMGASKITAILPYLAYARQDKEKKGESLAIASIGELLRTSHVSEVITIDVHSHRVENLFSLLIHNLSPAKMFAQKIKKLKLKTPTFVAPDEGAIERVQKVVEEFGQDSELAFMKKERIPSGVSSTLYGHIQKDAIVIDDILDTGSTLLACCEILKNAGAKNIYIFVTHGQFSGDKWQHLFNFNVKKIYCTDSIPQVYDLKQKRLEVISVKPLFEEYSLYFKQIQQEIKRAYREIREGKVLIPEEPPLFEEQ